MGRLKKQGGDVAGALAEWLGVSLRWLLITAQRLVDVLPGLLGPAVIIYGVTMIYAPAGWITAGLFLLLLDRRTGPSDDEDGRR